MTVLERRGDEEGRIEKVSVKTCQVYFRFFYKHFQVYFY